MPVLNGFELAQRLQVSPYGEMPLIASSASVSETEQSEAIAAGCDDFLPKPVEFDKLLRCLQKYLALTWIYDAAASPPTPPAPTVARHCALPTDEQLVTLRRAIRIGDIAAIEAEAERLRGLNPEYQEFCDRLCHLAAEFDDQGLQQLLARADQATTTTS